uniref:RUN domain-containing protein n=1 Tax=Petromyzon marinus TaxID=7757 RepID=S4RKL2_PETMA
GPSTKRLHGLYQHLCQLTELSSQSMRFNAFILGLLNMKSLDFWISYLHNHEGILTTHYLPEGFLAMPSGACAPLVDELVLLLQPLALLPFRLDERFEFASGEQQREQIRQHERLRSQFESLQRSVHSTFQFMRHWSNPTAAGAADATDAADAAVDTAAVPGEGVKEEERASACGPAAVSNKQPTSSQWQSRNVDWWQQLKESSQIYLTAEREGGGPKFSRWNRPHSFTYVKAGELPEKVSREPTRKSGGQDYLKKTPPSDPVAGEKKRGWLGSPPDSDDLDKPLEGGQAVERRGGDVEAPQPPAVLWLGRLFGASPHRQQQQKKNAKLPSSWLGLDMSTFGLVPSLPVATETNQATLSPDNGGSVSAEVTALCHHAAADRGQPSVRRGDVPQATGAVVPGRLLRHAQGGQTGPAP